MLDVHDLAHSGGSAMAAMGKAASEQVRLSPF
jgi:hypothetical protein